MAMRMLKKLFTFVLTMLTPRYSANVLEACTTTIVMSIAPYATLGAATIVNIACDDR